MSHSSTCLPRSSCNMILLIFIIAALGGSMFPLARAQDAALIMEAGKIFQQIADKCQEKPVPVERALSLASTCAEPILKENNLIPAALYPDKYKSLLDSCLGKLSPTANMCDRAMLEPIKKCAMQKGFSALPQLKKLYDNNKDEMLKLVTKLTESCSPEIQKL